MGWIAWAFLELVALQQLKGSPLPERSPELNGFELNDRAFPHGRDAGEGEVVFPQLYTPDLHSRLLVLRTTERTFYVALTPNRRLSDRAEGSLHYRGEVLSHPDGSAAFSVSRNGDQVSGVIAIKGDVFVVRPGSTTSPLTKQMRGKRNVSAHVLRKWSREEEFGPRGLQIAGRLAKSSIRSERSTEGRRKVVATAVFVDAPLLRQLDKQGLASPQRVADAVLAILNEVELIYNYQSLHTKFKIIVVNLETLGEKEDSPDPAGGDVDRYLESFCKWQSSRNPASPSPRHWDHALLLSGLDLHKMNGDVRDRKVLGMAWVNGMCRPGRSCTLTEGTSLGAAFVIAHEMGHSLGMQHDGQGNRCDPDAFLMAEKTGPGRTTWSQCSNEYLDAFFRKGFGSCLEDDHAEPLAGPDLPLPGQRFGLADQCQLSLGRDYRPHVAPQQPFDDVCRELWCVSGLWASVAHPALEGSACGGGKRCFQGACVNSSESSTASNSEIVEEMKSAVSDFLAKLRTAFHKLVTGPTDAR